MHLQIFVIHIMCFVCLVLVYGVPIKDPAPVQATEQNELPIPCYLLNQYKDLNVDVTLPCIETDDATVTNRTCILDSNSTALQNDCGSIPPFCEQLSGYNWTIPCQNKSAVELIPRNILDSEESVAKSPGIATPDCVRFSDDLSGQVTGCEIVRNYPEDLIKELVMEKKLKLVLPKEEIKTAADSDDESIVYNQACRASTRILRLQAAQLPSSGWKYIVNVDEFAQAITVDKCSKEHEACAEIDRFLGFGLVSRCVQKRAVRNLFTLNSNSNDLELEQFVFPTACICEVGRKYG